MIIMKYYYCIEAGVFLNPNLEPNFAPTGSLVVVIIHMEVFMRYCRSVQVWLRIACIQIIIKTIYTSWLKFA